MQPLSSLLDLPNDWVDIKRLLTVKVIDVTEEGDSLIDFASEETILTQCTQLTGATLEDMQLVEGAILLPLGPDNTSTPTPSSRLPSRSMSISMLEDMSQLDSHRPVDRRSPPSIKAGNSQTPVISRMSTTISDNPSIVEPALPCKMAASVYTIPEQVAIATVLPSRTTEAVIADLQLKRPQTSEDTPYKRLQSSAAPPPIEEPKPCLPLTQYVEEWTSGVNQCEQERKEEEDEGGYGDEDEEKDEIGPLTKPRKISERKRRQNYIADSYIQTALKKSLQKDLRVKPEEEAQQSARWLINQSESHQIISTPRAYQTELFEKAKEKNIIAVLDTGSGKTLIAVLLLRHIFAQELEDRAMGKRMRISFFLVASVTLVFQQHAVLMANLDQPMDMFCGDMNTDNFSRERWGQHFRKNMVIVCTAEILRQCLTHGFISMECINLLIFDEAHHAKKDHSYARIIKDFYHQPIPGTVLPKVFGMTASPVDTHVDVEKAARELEGLLHCQIATAADPSLGTYRISRQQELLLKYSSLESGFKTFLNHQMLEKLEKNVVFRKPLLFSLAASRELGSWCSDQVWRICLGEEETKRLLAKTEQQYHMKKVREPLDVLEKRKNLIDEARNIIKLHDFEPPHYDPQSDISRNLSSKVVQLIRCLRERYERATDDKAIVFVKQRYTARLLARLFSYPEIGTPFLKVGVLVGARSGEAGDANLSFREQVITMMKFRKSKINCLFATSVAEEGLDIPDCNLVIRFDLYDTLIQYIQSRGRARHMNSRYVHMLEEFNQDQEQIIREVRQQEDILDTFCKALPEDRLLSAGDFDLDHCLAKEKSHRVLTIPETGAKLTYKVSLTVLANFVDSLPHSHNTQLNPEYIWTIQNKRFVAEVILPEISPIRGTLGRPCSTKQVAKCSAAFETCLLLRKGKYLDENLVPIFTKQLPAMRNAILAVDSKKREAYNMRTKPDMWSEGGIPKQLFLTILVLDKPECLGRPSQPLALLTRSPLPELPSFILHFGAGKHSPIQIQSVGVALNVDERILRQINLFTLCIFEDVFSKGYASEVGKMPYFLAPIKSDFKSYSDPMDLIAWDVLKQIEDYQDKWEGHPWENKAWKDVPDEFFKDKYVVDPWDGSRKLWIVGIARQYKALDPIPANSPPRKATRKNNDNIMEYSCSLWPKARARRSFDENQPVVEARYISLRRNLLDEFDGSEVEELKKCFIILEPLKVSPLPTTVVAIAYVFPAIIHRVESYLIALEACNLLHLSIRPDLALEAVTKDSDNSEDHSNEQINFQRGMGANYERLEFLGDCFLKMATSISLYGIHPENDEYAYHVDRMMLICNKNLRNNAVRLKLYEYIRSHGFNRRAWYPEGLVLQKGKAATAPNSANLGDKTIADVCEALIGAALLTCHGTGDMDNAVRAVSELVCSDNHKVTTYSEYYQLYEKPKYQIAPSTAAQRNLAEQVEKEHAYRFKYPRLLRSAFCHSSYPFSYERVPSYQRLEFLGDALLDMACINYLFHKFPDRDPQWLTEHKMAMVSNQFLGALCVSLGFHRHLLLFHSGLQKQITDYVTEIIEARTQAEEDAVRDGKTKEECIPDFWTTVPRPPKCLPDMVEAYIGAIFVDSEYNYTEVERFFDEHIKWYFTDISIYDTFANNHPTTFLTKFLQINMGCMDWSIVTREIPNIEGVKPKIMAVVIIHSKVIAGHEAESSRYAKIGAAKNAVAILQGLSLPEFRQNHRCECLAEVDSSDVTDEPLHGTAI